MYKTDLFKLSYFNFRLTDLSNSEKENVSLYP